MGTHVDAFSFEDAARESPDAIALVTESDERLTFADVARRSRRVVHALRSQSLEGRPVGLVPTLRPSTIIAIYALIALGSPIVLLHPRLTPSERRVLLDLTGTTFVLDETWTDESLPPRDEPVVLRAHDAEHPLAIVFTSGSSGTPKGVVLTRRAFAAAAAASAGNVGWQPDDRWLLSLPASHVGGLSVIVRCFLARTTVVLSPWTGSVERFVADLVRFRVTLVSLVPTMLAKVLDEGPARPFPPQVRAAFIGGDAARPTLLARAVEHGLPVLTTYGLTEACSQVATQTYGEAPDLDGAVGPPLAGVEVRIVDGEVQVRGANLFSGYFPIAQNGSPFADDGWFRTGDLGELDARGRLRIRGRRSDLIITGGENVDPAEIERTLAACPGVRDVCVFGVDDERWGQLVAAAFVAHDAERPPSWSEIADFVATSLATFKRPRVAAFCEGLVLNGTGKLDRRATGARVRAALVPLR